MITIKFIGETGRGAPDDVYRLDIPKSGAITSKAKNLNEILFKGIPGLSKIRSEKSRREYENRIFPCIYLGNFSMIWIEERKEWIGFIKEYGPSILDFPMSEHPVFISGPYELDSRSANAIQKAYARPDIDKTEILKIPASELEKKAFFKNITGIKIFADETEKKYLFFNKIKNLWEYHHWFEHFMGHDAEPYGSTYQEERDVEDTDEEFIKKLKEAFFPVANRLRVDIPNESFKTLSIKRLIEGVANKDESYQECERELYIGKKGLEIYLLK